jgi:uncharacterized protein YidB (DUF937 family)
MSFLNSLKNQALRPNVAAALDAGRSPVLLAVCRLLKGSGALEALQRKFQSKGFGDIVHSWVSLGPNLPIDEKQLETVFGKAEIGRMAEDAGVPHDTLSEQISRALPSIIDSLTPDGLLPAQGFNEAAIRSAGVAWLSSVLH